MVNLLRFDTDLPASKGKETVYVPITKERFESWGPNSELRISGNKIRWTNDALAFAADLQFSSKEAFKTSIGKLSTTYPSITFVSDKPLIYQANSQYSINYDDRFLSWGESSHSLFANKMEDK